MTINERLKKLRKHTKVEEAKIQLKRISKELEKSIEEGYNGKVFSIYINKELGELLTAEGLKWTTYYDGEEFEESKIWLS